jgi:hypothetical protein
MERMGSTVMSALAVVRTGMRAARLLASDASLPWPLRVLFVIGMIQIPCSPVDELALVVALAWLLIWHRAQLRSAFATARQQGQAGKTAQRQETTR